MPEIHAFHGIRYDLGHVGSLSQVVAPPYDVISPELQDKLYKQHPANVIRLILNREEPGDDDPLSRYRRAAKYFREWQSQGVLFSEAQPSLYVYHQTFEYLGQTITRRGIMARVRLEPFGEGTIYPHEQTHSAAKVDRLNLMRACQANMSQIFGIYPDESNAAQEALEAPARTQTPLVCHDHLGIEHRMWPVNDLEAIQQATQHFSGKPVFIADGHHRYETALNYRNEIADGGELPSNHPANFVLMMLVSMNDPGMIVLPTHRLFSGVEARDSETLVQLLSPCFDMTVAGEGPSEAENIWEEIETGDDQGTIGLYAAADRRWVLASLNDDGRAKMKELEPEASEEWRSLGVSILHRLIVDTLLSEEGHPKPKYVHLVPEVEEGIQCGDFPLAAIVMPASLDHIQAISKHKERMPAKSTYFFPKLLSGLLFNPLAT
ncbi:Phosphatase [Planctomycetales bacterium 10988]|nr:Phosphatase [Planctomycetales bacterium 10988]